MLPWILLALSAGLGIWGAVSQGNAEREQAQQDFDRAEIETGWAIDDTLREKQQALAGMNAATIASGISGDSVEQALGYTAGEYNRVIEQINTKKDWAQDDLDEFMQQSKINQYFNIGSSLLTGGRQAYGLGVDQNLWGPGIQDQVTGSVIKPYFRQDRSARGSLFDWNRGYGR